LKKALCGVVDWLEDGGPERSRGLGRDMRRVCIFRVPPDSLFSFSFNSIREVSEGPERRKLVRGWNEAGISDEWLRKLIGYTAL